MKPSIHFIASLSSGATLWFFTKSLYAGAVCFFSGIFLDIDHAIDFMVLHGRRNFSWKKCYLACVQTAEQQGEYQFKKLYLIFHSGEIALVLWFLVIYTKNLYLLAGSIGYSIHLMLDSAANILHPYSYFIIWRAVNKFRTDRLQKIRFYKKGG